MIEIINGFNPFRMKLSRREPVQLSVEVVNRGADDTMVTLEVSLPGQLSMEHGGYRKNDVQKIPQLKPGERKRFYYELWPKQATRIGDEHVLIAAVEHHQSFDYVKKEYRKTVPLPVEE